MIMARPACLEARESQFMIVSRMRKKLCPTMGFVKKSAKLSTVRTYGTMIISFSTASRTKK